MKNFKGPRTKNKVEIHKIKIKELIAGWHSQTLLPYDFNRGALGVRSSRVKKMSESFFLPALGSICTYEQNGVHVLLDFHHRMASLLELYDAGELDSLILNSEIPLIVVHTDDRLKAYQILNAGKSHTGSEKATNPELAVGSYFDDLNAIDGIEIKSGQVLNVMDVLYATDSKGTNVDIEDVFSSRSKVTALLDDAVDRNTFKFSNAAFNRVKGGLLKAAAIKSQVQTRPKASTPKETYDIVNNPGFLLAVLTDYVSDGNAFGGFSKKSTKRIINKLSGRNAKRILDYSKTISRRNRKELKSEKLATLLS